MANIGGILSFYADGSPIEVEASMEIQPEGFMNEAVNTATGGVHRKRVPITPQFSGTIVITGDTPRSVFQVAGVTAQLDGVNGKRYTLHGAFYEGEPRIDIIEGTMPYVLSGTSMDITSV